MRLSHLLTAAALSTALVCAIAAPKRPLPSTHTDDGVQVQGSTLVRNGGGFRYKGAERLSHVDIYAPQRFRSMEEFLRQKGPKRITLTMMRDVPAGLTGKALSRGIEDNLPRSALTPLLPGLIRLSDFFSTHKNIATGDQIIVDWLPGQGGVLSFRGQQAIEAFPQPEFFAAYAAMWIGPAPADPQLKQALLGQP
ncbi:MAG: chalcone isomerase family protein [Rhodoferax sp.]